MQHSPGLIVAEFEGLSSRIATIYNSNVSS
jgi:hypothetical protein